ncbi:hypothetical protein HYALB_00003759 [Hymenoscyphus albidus]|uniref:Uncharacterized protein n=1 Tax=Hymenoscyphus albidus TaxID=595503 RepID=A0A9N9LYD6_9HELO|nr:hypothetical protein HYALB_00003759 [Hymenoscyphus albidus]
MPLMPVLVNCVYINSRHSSSRKDPPINLIPTWNSFESELLTKNNFVILLSLTSNTISAPRTAIRISKSKSTFEPKSTYRRPALSDPKVSFKTLLKALYRIEYERTYHKPPPKAKEFPYITMEPILPRLEPDAYKRIAQRLNYLRALDFIRERNNDRVESKWTVTSSIKSNWKMVNKGSYGTAIKELSEV